jgi:hypothetical protein
MIFSEEDFDQAEEISAEICSDQSPIAVHIVLYIAHIVNENKQLKDQIDFLRGFLNV